MKPLSVLAVAFSILLCASGASAQTYNINWTKTDCDGNTHNLFSEVDTGGVVIMDFAMTNCSFCIQATSALEKIDAKFAVSNPGKLHHYAMGYTDAYTCTDLNDWKTQNNFTIPVITKCAADVKAYGGMGMPTLVIIGGPNHKVLYQKQGFAPKDTAAIFKAIQTGMQSAAVAPNMTRQQFRVYSTASGPRLQFDLAETSSIKAIDVLDILGRPVASIVSNATLDAGHHDLPLFAASVASGSYLVHVVLKEGSVVSIPFAVSR